MAIQINGTTVINNSRALTNITSVDSTTATAIGNAGVGGSSTLITNNASASGTGITVSLTGGYQRYIIQITGIVFSNTGSFNGYGNIRWTNSSNSVVTGGYAYSWDGANSYSVSANQQTGYTDFRNTGPYSYYNTGIYQVFNHASSSAPTFVTFNYAFTPTAAAAGGGNSVGSVWQNYGYFGTSNSLIIQPTSTITGGSYSVWGVS